MKLALLYAFRTSEWKSCVSITQNIRNSYEQLNHEIQYFDYDHLKGELHLEDLADELKNFNPDKIVFIDHRPTPKQILERLVKRKINVPLIIHLYGDFSVYCNDWLEQESILKNFKVSFLTASTKHQNFVSQFLNDASIVTRVPFSIDTKTFQYQESKIDHFYKKYDLDKTDTHFIYAGRITTQKNVVELTGLFKRMIQDQKNKSILLIAGDIDDMGRPFHGDYIAPGTTQLQLLKNLGPQIKWIGSLNSQELATAYSACDSFISLSTFHDEDFGMAPLEAASTGASVILTSWGGYSDFIKTFKMAQSIDVSLDEQNRYAFDPNQVIHSLLEQKKLSKEERIYQSESAKKEFSIKKISSIIEEEVCKDGTYFPGFNRLFWQFTSCFRRSPSAPFNPTTLDNSMKEFQKIYSEAYLAYSI